MKTLESTSTRLCVELTPTIRLYGQRHSDRRTGYSVWETWFEKYGKWKVYDNPFDNKDFRIEEKWGIVKANMYRNVVLAKRWNYKQEILDVLKELN